MNRHSEAQPKNRPSAVVQTMDLLRRWPALRRLLDRRWFQFATILPVLFFLVFFIVAGVLGTPVGNRNIIVVFVWILWWFLLIAVLMPFGARIWCTACPIPFLGESLQRRRLIGVRTAHRGSPDKQAGVQIGHNVYAGSNRKWPKLLSNIWLQNFGFLLLCTFSALLLTRPLATLLSLLGLLGAALVTQLIFRLRVFCRFICPIGGFLSLYSMASTLEVRARDPGVCRTCSDKGCAVGNDRAWGCPWMLFPSRLDRNNACGLCMECIKGCSHDNMTVRLRPPFSDRRIEGYDEAWKAFIMLSLALAYSVIYLGPWGELKDWVNVLESNDWSGFLAYAAGLWALALVVTPGMYAAAVWFGRRLAGKQDVTFREAMLALTYPLVPVGLFVWIAFSIPLILVNGSYILNVASDPMGWGWNLFGTANLAWSPLIPEWIPLLQAILVLIGLFAGLMVGFDQARRVYANRRRAAIGFLPVGGLLTGLSVLLLRIYTG